MRKVDIQRERETETEADRQREQREQREKREETEREERGGHFDGLLILIWTLYFVSMKPFI